MGTNVGTAAAARRRPILAFFPRLRARAAAILGALLLAIVVFWLVENAVHDIRQFALVSLNGVTNGSIYALVAIGYTLVYGILELINFAHGDVFSWGAMITYSVGISWLGAAGHSGLALFGILAAALFCAAAFCATLNMAVERVAYRRLRNAPRLAPLITAIGMSFVLSNAIAAVYGFNYVSTEPLLPRGALFTIGGQAYGWDKLIVLLITVPTLAGLVVVVKRTRWGKAMRATAQNRDAARLMGIDVDRAISFAFGLGGALAGIGGFVYLVYFTQGRFDLGFRIGLFAFTAAVLGGIGNILGAALGGYLIGFIENYNSGLTWHAPGPSWTESLVFILLILILVFRPHGLLGETLSTRS
ncbi:MAG TPA: branched-chain amino acid ABC transporter permease [Gaiellaceae bacterium]|nr:branched-chain amino acid ABC transporter permease [Gaiellaceae bacterium]